jgi:serine/threonine-protein kinase
LLDDVARVHVEEVTRRAKQSHSRPPSHQQLLEVERNARDRTRLRFLQEGEALGALNNPHIVQCLRAGTLDDGVSYLVLDHVPGQPLSAHLRTEPLPLHVAVEVAARISDGLAQMHDRRMVHRDIKPDNVILDVTHHEGAWRVESVKIIDLGIAKVRSERAALRTNAGAILGTDFYMSPEQASGKAVDHRSDIFSLGLLFYEMMTARNPFHDESHLAHLAKLADAEPPSLASSLLRINIRMTAQGGDLQSRLDRIVARALAKSPDERYPTTREFTHEILGLLSDEESRRLAPKLPSLHVIPEGKAHHPTRSADVGTSTAPTAPPPSLTKAPPGGWSPDAERTGGRHGAPSRASAQTMPAFRFPDTHGRAGTARDSIAPLGGASREATVEVPLVRSGHPREAAGKSPMRSFSAVIAISGLAIAGGAAWVWGPLGARRPTVDHNTKPAQQRPAAPTILSPPPSIQAAPPGNAVKETVSADTGRTAAADGGAGITKVHSSPSGADSEAARPRGVRSSRSPEGPTSSRPIRKTPTGKSGKAAPPPTETQSGMRDLRDPF